MINQGGYDSARKPEDLSRFSVERANAGDVEGLVAVYQRRARLPDAAGPSRRPLPGTGSNTTPCPETTMNKTPFVDSYSPAPSTVTPTSTHH